MPRARRRSCARRATTVRLGFEPLEGRQAPALGFGTVLGLGASGQFADLRANDEAIDAAGDLVVVGSLMGTVNFNPNGAAVNVAASGNRDAYVAEFSPSGALNWVVPFPGQATSAVGQASAVAVDSSGNIEVAGSFSGTVKFGATTLAAPSRTDAFVAKLTSAGSVVWAVQTTGAANQVDSAVAVAPDGSGGAYIAGSYMGSMTVGSTALSAVGQTEAFAAHLNSSGSVTWAKSTTGSAGSVAGMGGLAVDPSGRVVMAGFFSGSVNFNPGGSTVLAGAGSYDVATWVLNSDGSLAWARGFGGSNYDQAEAVGVDSSGDVYVTGAFSGTVNFNPSGTAVNLTAGGIYDVFVLKLTPAGATAWADSFAGSNGPAMGDGIGVDPSGHVDVAGWFAGTLDFDPGPGTDSIASRGDEDVFVAMLDASGNLVAATTGGGSGSDTAFGLAINASGTIAVAGKYTGPSSGTGTTSFGSTNLAAIGSADIFVASLNPSGSVSIGAPNAPTLEAASDSGASDSDGLTDVTSPTFDVTGASTGFTVQLLRDGVVVASRTGPGPITDPGRVPDGVHQYTAQQVDAAGTAGAASPAIQITIDATAPAAPPSPTLLSADDSGALGDGITNINRPRLTGTAEAGATVRLLIAGSVVGTGTATGGSFTILLNAALADGTYSVTATATDAAGNASPTSGTFSLTIDATPPATPPASALLAADDSGTVGDGITNVNRPRLTGTAAPGATVRLFAGASLVGTGTATGGIYTIQVASALADGTYSITATATDAAGNVSAAGAAFSLTIDTAPPAAPPAPAVLAADDSGAVGDGITNVNRPRLTGTAAPGATVRLLIAGSVVGVGTAVGGTYSILLNAALADGTYAIAASATDAAGNTGAAGAPFALTIDATPPAAPSVPSLLAADDSGATGDGITNVRKPRLVGTAEAGSTVRLFSGATLLGTATATGGTYTITPTSPLADGTYSITATATDAAGNVSAAGAPLALTIDANQPAAPSAPVLLAADDSGALGDGITNDSTPRLTGSAEAGSTVRLFADGALVGTAVAAGGSYSIAIAPALGDSTYAITASATDLAGNTSLASAPFALTVDSAPPAAPAAPGLLAADDSGTLGDGITNVVRPRLTGTAEPGTTVQLSLGGSAIGLGVATGGSYTILLNTALPDGTYSITATATDAAGNIGAAGAPFVLTIDTTVLAAPAAPVLATADDSGAVGDGITNVTRPHLTGSAQAGTIVRLFANGTILGSGTSIGGTYTIVPISALIDGTYSVTATAIDAAGNASPAGAPFALTIDTKPPAAPAAPGLPAADDSGALGDGITDDNTPRLTGSAEAGSTVQLFIAGSLVGSGPSVGGSYTISPGVVLADGTYSITARATDAAGNIGPSSPPFALTIDTAPPAAPAAPRLLAADDSGASGDGTTNVKGPRLTGSAEAGSTVTLFIAGAVVGTGTATGGTYTIPIAPVPADGTYSVTVSATDAAGNASPSGAAFSLTIDTRPPAAPPAPGLLAADDSGALGDGITNDSTPRLTGSAEAGSSVGLFLNGRLVGTATATAGSYTIAIAAALANGSYTVTAIATDLAGNVSPTGAAFRLTIDTAAPAAPTLALLAADDTGVKGDGVTEVHAPRFTGTAEPGSLVQLLSASGAVVASAAASAGGTYTITAPGELVGTFVYRVRSVDAAGNLGATSPAAAVRILAVADDYDGDGKADVMTYDAATGYWSIRLSTTGSTVQVPYGVPGKSVPIVADYDGDGKADLAVYVPSTGDWYIFNSSTKTTTHFVFGAAGDIPVPADYLGQGHAEPTVYRPSTGQWFVYNIAANQIYTWDFGIPNLSLPEPAPYAGYGAADLGVYEPSTGDWYTMNTTNWALVHTVFGGPGFAPVPADYDGDGKADISVYWPAAAQWIIMQSTTATERVVVYGEVNVDQPVPLDYDGDGKADFAIYRPPTSVFRIRMSANGPSLAPVVGTVGADEAAAAPWTYLFADQVRLAAAQPVSRPAFAAEADFAPATPPPPPATPPPAPAATPAPAIAMVSRPAVAVTSGKGTPVPQPIKWKGWTSTGAGSSD